MNKIAGREGGKKVINFRRVNALVQGLSSPALWPQDGLKGVYKCSAALLSSLAQLSLPKLFLNDIKCDRSHTLQSCYESAEQTRNGGRREREE